MIHSELFKYPKLSLSLGVSGTKCAIPPSWHKYSSQVCEETGHWEDAATQTQEAFYLKDSFFNALFFKKKIYF